MTIETKNKHLPFDLQFFAEDPPSDPPADPPADPPETIELTQIELDKKIESEADRKLNSALQKKQQEWDNQLQEKINEALKENERLSKLSEKERKDEELSKREKEIAEREAKAARKELRSDAIADLTDKSLPPSFADFLLGEDAEKTLENINNFKTAFDSAVNEAVKEKLRQDTPRAGGGGFTSGKAPSVAELAQEHRLIK